MRAHRIGAPLATLAAAALLGSCGDHTAPPTPGWLAVELVTPYADDAGVVLEIRGAPVDSVRSTARDLFVRQLGADTTRVIVGGSLSAGKIADIYVPDVRAIGQYVAVVREAVQQGTYAQRDAGAYGLALRPSR